MTTVADRIRAARAELAEALQSLPNDQRIMVMTDACIETGGSLVPPAQGKGGAHYAEISCLGIYHSGNDVEEAIANWIKAVHRTETGQQVAA